VLSGIQRSLYLSNETALVAMMSPVGDPALWKLGFREPENPACNPILLIFLDIRMNLLFLLKAFSPLSAKPAFIN